MLRWVLLAFSCTFTAVVAAADGQWHAGEYQVLLQTRSAVAPENATEPESCVRVLKDGQELYQRCEMHLTVGTAEDNDYQITDQTGDGIPDLVLSSWSGGAHCCRTVYLLQLGTTVREVQVFDAKHSDGVTFRNLDTDAPLELAGMADWSYAYKFGSFSSSYARPSVWQPVGDHYEIDTGSLSQPALSASEFSKRVSEFQANEEWQYQRVPAPLVFTALELATAGHLMQAIALVQESQPEAKPDSAAIRFLAQLTDVLYESEWWREYIYLNLSSAVRLQRDSIVQVPSGVVVGREKSTATNYAIGVRPAHDSNYFAYQADGIALHKVAAASQRVAAIQVEFEKDDRGHYQSQLKLKKSQAPTPVTKSFTMEYVNHIKSLNAAIMAPSPATPGKHSLAAAAVQPLTTKCPAAVLTIQTEQFLGKTYSRLQVQAPERQSLLLPWGSNLEYLSCEPGQPLLVGLLTCRGNGYCGQALVAQF
ncbi:hypothetical protein [Rheinheimera tilapiae]|uniref:VCBS repeat-containing protein n=1 Tax=Rheinheimera tilapiae TaxID=875043 RepID=A0ABV6B7R4_9GAMM